MNEHVKMSQQQEDTQTQKNLTDRVGVKLETPQKSNFSPWTTVKRLFRTG